MLCRPTKYRFQYMEILVSTLGTTNSKTVQPRRKLNQKSHLFGMSSIHHHESDHPNTYPVSSICTKSVPKIPQFLLVFAKSSPITEKFQNSVLIQFICSLFHILMPMIKTREQKVTKTMCHIPVKLNADFQTLSGANLEPQKRLCKKFIKVILSAGSFFPYL